MQTQKSLRCLLVYVLALVVLCYFRTSEAATQHQAKAHSHRTLRNKHHDQMTTIKHHQDNDNDQKDDKQEEDDDDDDDDDEEEESPATKSEEKEKEELEADVAETKKDLRVNLAEQKELKNKLKHLSDESASDMEIDAQAKLVSNETESPAMGTMLAKMWKEMRMFELPFFAQHVEEEVHLLKREEKRLESELTEQEAKLTDAKKKRAEEEAKKLDEEEKKKDEEETDEKKESAALDKADKDEESKEDDDDGEETNVANVASGVNSVESGGEEHMENLKNGRGRRVLAQYSYWHMSGAQKTNTLIASLVYFAFGILIAVLYDQVRKRHPEYLNPHPVQERAGASYQMQQKDFTNSIFGCFADFHVCISGCCCTACRWSHTLDQKNIMKYWKAFFLMFILMVIHPYTVGLSEVAMVIAGVYFRQRLRQKYGIERATQTVVLDCLAWMCCMPCAVIQEAREDAVKRDFGNINKTAHISPTTTRMQRDLSSDAQQRVRRF